MKQKVFNRNRSNRPQIPKFGNLRSQSTLTILPPTYNKINSLATVGRINSLATVGERLAHDGCTTPLVECSPFKHFENLLLDNEKSSSLGDVLVALDNDNDSSKTLPPGSAPPNRRTMKSVESDTTLSSWWRRKKKNPQEGKTPGSVGSRESSGCESLISLGELSLPGDVDDAVFSRAEPSKSLNRNNLVIDLKSCCDVTNELPCNSAPPLRDFEKGGKRFFAGKFPQIAKRKEGKGLSLRETVGEIMKIKRK